MTSNEDEPDPSLDPPLDRSAGERLFRSAAGIAQALASPPRLRLMGMLSNLPRSVDDLATRLGQSRATTSAQLKVLAQAGLVRGERQGKRVFYEPASEAAVALYLALRSHALTQDPAVAAKAAEVAERAPLYQGSLFELEEKVREGKLTLLDLRSEEEWRRAHIANAMSLPFESLPSEARGAHAPLPKRRRYVAYCAGPVCAKAVEGTARLRSSGLRVLRLAADLPEARLAGLRIETPESPTPSRSAS